MPLPASSAFPAAVALAASEGIEYAMDRLLLIKLEVGVSSTSIEEGVSMPVSSLMGASAVAESNPALLEDGNDMH